jgi:predicted site-specific integrase-resolvase
VRHLTQFDLADRWRISHRTLERWRSAGVGPAYLKLGGSVSYRLDDVEAYEAAQRRTAAAQAEGALSKAERFVRGMRR